MLRLILFAGIALIAWRLLTGRRAIVPKASGPRSGRLAPDRDHARTLLGVGAGASREDIIEAHKKLIAMVHPDRGGTNEQVHEANHARDVLLSEAAPRNTEHP